MPSRRQSAKEREAEVAFLRRLRRAMVRGKSGTADHPVPGVSKILALTQPARDLADLYPLLLIDARIRELQPRSKGRKGKHGRWEVAFPRWRLEIERPGKKQGRLAAILRREKVPEAERDAVRKLYERWAGNLDK
jgi:hypothetical protein